jgi:SAM-dependent methyltransferase
VSVSPAEMAEARRLNLGCGTTSAPGWVNVDGSWAAWLSRHAMLRRLLLSARLIPDRSSYERWPDNVIVRDLRKRLPFAAESFDAIYASHVVEHLYRADALQLLIECRRILRPGGVLRVVVPDLRAIVDEYLGGRRIGAAEESRTGDACERLNNRLMLRQARPPDGPLYLRLYSFLGDFHSHKWAYDVPHLSALFEEAGFDGVGARQYLDSTIPGLADVEQPSRLLDGEGIAVEGNRPGTCSPQP